MSRSVKLRQEGNEVFTKALDETMPRVVRRSRFDNAVVLYENARNVAESGQEIASATKNIMACHYRRAQMETAFGEESDIVFGTHCLSSGLQESIVAIKQAQENKKKLAESWNVNVDELVSIQSWAEKILETTDANIQEHMGPLTQLGDQKHFELLHGMCMVYGHSNKFSMPLMPAVRLNLDLGSLCLKISVKLITKFNESQDHSTNKSEEEKKEEKRVRQQVLNNARSYLERVREALERARSFTFESEQILDEFEDQLEDLSSSVNFQLSFCDSQSAMREGDELFQRCVFDEENLSQDGIWLCIDRYREAIILTKEIDLETEAEANYHLGYIYSRLLNVKERGHQHFLKTVELVNVLWPKVFTNVPWYKDCLQRIKEHQDAKLDAERAAHEKEREPYLKELEPELTVLKAEAQKSNESFLKFLYKTHPPKDSTQTLVIEGQAMKKVLTQSLRHYHPDKQVQYEMKWRVLAEEITKILTNYYERLKG